MPKLVLEFQLLALKFKCDVYFHLSNGTKLRNFVEEVCFRARSAIDTRGQLNVDEASDIVQQKDPVVVEGGFSAGETIHSDDVGNMETDAEQKDG